MERIEHLGREVGRLESAGAAKDETIAAQQETIAQLRAQLEQLTASEHATQDAPAPPGAPAMGEPAPAASVPSAGLWDRLRAALLGH